VVAGQGAIAFEILEQVPDVTDVIVPIGGGGLIAGIASAFAQLEPELGRRVRIVGVQAANAAAYPPSLEAGEPLAIATGPTIADGIAVGRPGALNFSIVRAAVDEVVTVGDDDTARALVVLLERAKLVVEPAGAVGVAAVLAD
jgi:threonine dehydratase